MDYAQTTQLLLVTTDCTASKVMKTARRFLNIHILNQEISNTNEATGTAYTSSMTFPGKFNS